MMNHKHLQILQKARDQLKWLRLLIPLYAYLVWLVLGVLLADLGQALVALALRPLRSSRVPRGSRMRFRGS